jgi:membrane-associated phospholipid phosphatase
MEVSDRTEIILEQPQRNDRQNRVLWASAVSVAMHPLLMATLLYALVFNYMPVMVAPIESSAQLSLLFVIFVFTATFPALSSYMLYRTGTISSLRMSSRNDRFLPMLFTSVIYLAVSYLFVDQLRFGQVIVVAIGSITTSVILLTGITFFWKMSAHAVGIGGVTGFMLALSFKYPDNEMLLPIVLLIILSGLVCSARLALNAHTPLQIIAGYMLGFSICGSAVLLFE